MHHSLCYPLVLYRYSDSGSITVMINFASTFSTSRPVSENSSFTTRVRLINCKLCVHVYTCLWLMVTCDLWLGDGSSQGSSYIVSLIHSPPTVSTGVPVLVGGGAAPCCDDAGAELPDEAPAEATASGGWYCCVACTPSRSGMEDNWGRRRRRREEVTWVRAIEQTQLHKGRYQSPH